MADRAVEFSADRRSPHILHIHGSFNRGGKEARAVQLMNIWGDRARHSIVSAAPDAMGARAAIDPALSVAFPDPPPRAGAPGLNRFKNISKFLK
ncbi:MAG: glycosyltransferase family 1 protein, partial [bacterium]|nr:glycosyltransferase family 1 protein [bacterium]